MPAAPYPSDLSFPCPAVWGLLDRSWGHLRRFGVTLGEVLGSVLGGLLAALEASWVDLSGSRGGLGSLWCALGLPGVVFGAPKVVLGQSSNGLGRSRVADGASWNALGLPSLTQRPCRNLPGFDLHSFFRP